MSAEFPRPPGTGGGEGAKRSPWVSGAIVVGRVCLQVVRYLAPLTRDALVYLLKLLFEAMVGLQQLWWLWQARRHPATAGDLERRAAALRERRSKRWATWRALPWPRRGEIALAMVVLVSLSIAGARMWSRPRAPSSSRVDRVESPVGVRSSSNGAATEGVDVRKAAEDFAAARERLAPGEWAVLSEAHVLDRGARGAWDDYGVGSPIVIREAGERYRMWYVGCHLAMREHSCGVGHATSSDGVVWEKLPQPVFMPPDSIAQDNLTEIAVLKIGDRYSLWYSVAADYAAGRRRATLNLATSPDGLVWTDQGQVHEGEGLLPLSIEHSVVHDGQRFHMWYVAAIEELNAPDLLHLSSADGKDWTALGGTPLKSLQRDMEEIGRLTVETAGDRGFRAWFTLSNSDQKYQSKALGALVSLDGTAWQIQPVDTDPFKALLERQGNLRMRAVTEVHDPVGMWLWVTLVDAYPHDQCIGVAFRNGS